MTAYAFQKGIPIGFRTDFEFGIFHKLMHVQLQSTAGLHSFVLIDQENQLIMALIHVHSAGDEAISPYRSPYGSFLFSEKLTEEELLQFVWKVEEELKRSGVKNFILKNQPDAYIGKRNSLLEQILLQSNYQIVSDETSAVIPVTDDDYDSLLHRTKKPRLKKCHEMGFMLQEVSTVQLPGIYNFLKDSRTEKGYTLSMDLLSLEKVVEKFPKEFFLHAVTHENNLIAASISIQVLPNVLYCFYYDHRSDYDAVSPVVFLCEGLYQFCRSRGIAIVDLGTSNPDGKLNEALLDFKRSLGAQPSRKLTFIKNFH